MFTLISVVVNFTVSTPKMPTKEHLMKITKYYIWWGLGKHCILPGKCKKISGSAFNTANITQGLVKTGDTPLSNLGNNTHTLIPPPFYT